jgi:hypothetical protein
MKEHFVQQLVPARSDSSLALDIRLGRARTRTRAILESEAIPTDSKTATDGRRPSSSAEVPESAGKALLPLSGRAAVKPIAGPALRTQRAARPTFNFFPLQFCIHLNPAFLK